MRKIIKFATVGLPACAMLALAQPASAEDTSNASTAKASDTKQAGSGSAAKKYCLKLDLETGTRVSRPECKTKAEWAEEGVEVKAKS